MGATKTCRICGKEYEACHTNKLNSNIFRWQDVACCPEHGSMYIAKIRASRNIKPVEENINIEELLKSDNDENYFDDEDDNEFDECFSDYEDNI